MHTAQQIRMGMFECAVGGVEVDALSVLGDYDRNSRLGVVMTEPFGAIGASLLVQLAILRFYEERPERRDGAATYPEIYLFHCGGRYGSHASFDFWPPRREVFVDADPAELLGALNSYAITHLVVPEGEPCYEAEFGYTDPGAAYDRMLHCFEYSPSGRVAGDNETIAIRGLDEAVTQNTRVALNPRGHVEHLERARGNHPNPRAEHYLTAQRARVEEVPQAELAAVVERRRATLGQGLPCETYREISLDQGLARLGALGGVTS